MFVSLHEGWLAGAAGKGVETGAGTGAGTARGLGGSLTAEEEGARGSLFKRAAVALSSVRA